MNLAGERKAVADLLTAGGVRAIPNVPEKPTASLAMVVPGSPYLSTANTFGGVRTLRLDVWLVIGEAADNAKLSNAVDQRIEQALAILEADEWLLDDVQVDQWEPASGGSFLVAVIGIRTDLNP